MGYLALTLVVTYVAITFLPFWWGLMSLLPIAWAQGGLVGFYLGRDPDLDAIE